MEKNLFQKKVLLFVAMGFLTWMFVLPGAHGSVLTSTPPAIDGNASEWTLQNSTRISVTGGFVHLMNDATYLYVLIDVTSDTGNDPLPDNDYFWLAFDVNQNQQLDPNVDVLFSTIGGSLAPCLSYLLGCNSDTGCQSPVGYLLSPGFGTSVNDPITPHRIWELQIPRSLINITDNKSLRFALRLFSTNPSFTYDTPEGFFCSFNAPFLTDQMDQPGSVTGLIDPAKWANLEFIRSAENGALHSAVRSYENPLGNMLLLKDPSAVNSIEAKVTVNAISGTNNAIARARIAGFFFSSTDVNGTGDYYAEILMGKDIGDIGNGLRAFYFVERCFGGLQCTSADNPHVGQIGPFNIGDSLTLGIAYDGSNTFSFKVNGSVVRTFQVGPYSGPPSVQWKGIGTRVFGPLGPGDSGYVDAKFENVLLNGNPTAIRDISGMIDRTTWDDSTLEFVREQISEGVYGMGLRSYGSFANNTLNLVNGQNFNEIQADLTLEQLINLAQPNPATPMAALHGNFYNAGGANTSDHTDQTGDIKVLVGIRLGVPTGQYSGQPVGFYNVVKCTKHDCNKYNGANPNDPNNEFQRLYYYEDPNTIGPDLVGKPHRVSIRYDAANNTFTFGFDGRLTAPGPSSPGWIVPPPLPANQGPPNAVQKGPLTRIAFFSGLSGEGSVSAQFANIATVVDTDGDGVPDSVDNCPTVYNPAVPQWIDYQGNINLNSQPDFNLNGIGDACDLCPKVVTCINPPCPNLPCPGGGTSSTTDNLITVTVTYNGTVPTYLVPPDCNNVVFNSNPVIPQICRRIPPYVLTVLDDGSGYGSPGGDWIQVTTAPTSWTITCDLLEIFDAKALQAARNVQITPTYSFFETDRGLDPTGTCAQGDVCVDTTKYNLFQGTIPTQTVSVNTKNATLPVSIDIKPGSPLPKTINLGSHGNVPVAILSTADFNATTVDPTTVEMGGASVRVVGKKGTYQEEISDVNGDGRLDMIVHFDTTALSLASDAVQVCVTGSTTGGIAFKGCQQIRIVP